MSLKTLLPPVSRAARETPPTRDRTIDAIRGASLFVVVFGHLLMAIVYWPAGEKPVLGNLMADYPAMQLATWLLQVMPLFFAFGGAANLIAWKQADARGVVYSAWMWGRVKRLLRPVLVYLAVMAVVATILTYTIGEQAQPMLGMCTGMLWFLGVYVLTTALLPFAYKIHQHNKYVIYLALIPIIVTVNLGTMFLGWPAAIGMLNVLLVWLLVQQMGFLYAEGTGGPKWLLLAAGAFAINIALVARGPWPMSLVGLPGDVVNIDSIRILGNSYEAYGWHGEYSNMFPPSIVLGLHAVTVVSLAFAARGPLTRLLQKPKAWWAACFMSVNAMSLYLWHIPSIIAAIGILHFTGHTPPTRLNAAGYPEPINTLQYMEWFGLFFLVFVVILSILVLVTWSTEYRPLPIWDRPPRHGLVPLNTPGWVYVTITSISVALLGMSILVVAAIGYSKFPFGVVDWSGIPMNTFGALCVLAGSSLALRSLTRQPRG